METLRKITLKVDITRDDSGDVLLNGFGPKSQMGRAYLMVLHGALEEAVHEAEGPVVDRDAEELVTSRMERFHDREHVKRRLIARSPGAGR
mgnify:CR=1 FL=1